MIETATARAVLAQAQKSGADFAELYMEDTESHRVLMTDGKVEEATYSRIRGAGVRVLKGCRSAYAYTADTAPESLISTAHAAAAALGSGDADAPVAPFSARGGKTPQVIAFSEIGNDRRVLLLRDATRVAKDISMEVTQLRATYLDIVQHMLVCNTEGALVTDERPRTRVAIEAVATADGQAQRGFEGPGCARGFEAYGQMIDVCAAARDAAHMAVTMLHAPECPAGRMPVVIDGGFGGVIFHEACGHSLEATSVSRGNSEFCGRLGEMIAAPCVSAVDDGTLENEWGTLHFDDEGEPTRRNVLIENGVLKSYLVDKLGGRRMSLPVTGSARRQGYMYAPTSRMTNTFLCPGKDDEEDMIRSLDFGLYAKRMGGGSVNPATGEFNFSVAEGYLIRDGRIQSPVRGATLIGRGADVLLKIDRVGPRMWMGQGMCGSISGLIPTNVGQPRIRVSEITVGGKGGAI